MPLRLAALPRHHARAQALTTIVPDDMLPTPARAPMLKEHPDHHDAEIVMRLYELRREPVMRESRKLMVGFMPRAFEDVQAVMKQDHPLNAAFRQTSTYWEMAYGMVKHGILHGDYMLESNGEGLLLYAKMRPFVQQYRDMMGPRAFVNAEWVATNTTMGQGMLKVFEARVAKLLEAAGR